MPTRTRAAALRRLLGNVRYEVLPTHATQIVSNLTFDPRVLRGWVRRVRIRSVTTPILQLARVDAGAAELRRSKR